MKLDPVLYQRACDNYEITWALIDEVFYNLCEQYPGHGSLRVINAKLLIISRTYSTGLERKGKATGQQGGALGAVAEYINAKHRDVDAIFESLRGVSEPLQPEDLTALVRAHGQFTNLLTAALRPGQTPRSFVSKYMHFHCCAMPIYDNWAAKAARKWRRPGRPVIELPQGGDKDYFDYIVRFWQIYQAALDRFPTASVRIVDRYLVESTEAQNASAHG